MKNSSESIILIVDDKPANILVLDSLLAADDRVLMHANSGDEALMIALKNEISLIILDVQMPDMNGFEVAQVLKMKNRTKDIPIIFATAENKDLKYMLKGYEEGAVDYLTKPLDPEIVKAKVAVLLKIQLQKKELVEKNLSLQKSELLINKLNQQLQNTIVELEYTNKELESFSYSVSHDLRAPLRAINAYAGMIAEDYKKNMDVEALRLFGNIQANAVKMGRLIDDLLEFSRLGRKEVEMGKVNMDELVNNVLQEIEIATEHRAKVTVQPLPPAKGDYSLLRQVWMNLLSNAIKYSAKKESPEVEVGCKQENEELIYFVKDNGAGFDMKYADKLFGVFQRLHSQKEFEGTGVGLAIAKRIINKHNGRIWVEAEQDEGASFYFTLLGA